jgi:methionyl-tRNA synthetase
MTGKQMLLDNVKAGLMQDLQPRAVTRDLDWGVKVRKTALKNPPLEGGR